MNGSVDAESTDPGRSNSPRTSHTRSLTHLTRTRVLGSFRLKIHPALLGFFATALCATATANNFSVSGSGGPIADCPFAPGTWNLAPTWLVFSSTVSVVNPVTSITKVRLTGLQGGDFHLIWDVRRVWAALPPSQ